MKKNKNQKAFEKGDMIIFHFYYEERPIRENYEVVDMESEQVNSERTDYSYDEFEDVIKKLKEFKNVSVYSDIEETYDYVKLFYEFESTMKYDVDEVYEKEEVTVYIKYKGMYELNGELIDSEKAIEIISDLV